MMTLDDGVLAHGGIDLFFKVVYEFRSYILAVDKPARVIDIPERYVINEFCTDIDFNTVKSVKQQSSEFGVKFIKVVNTFERSTRFQLMVTMFQAWKFYLVWERIESKPVITDIKEDFFCFLLVKMPYRLLSAWRFVGLSCMPFSLQFEFECEVTHFFETNAHYVY